MDNLYLGMEILQSSIIDAGHRRVMIWMPQRPEARYKIQKMNQRKMLHQISIYSIVLIIKIIKALSEGVRLLFQCSLAAWFPLICTTLSSITHADDIDLRQWTSNNTHPHKNYDCEVKWQACEARHNQWITNRGCHIFWTDNTFLQPHWWYWSQAIDFWESVRGATRGSCGDHMTPALLYLQPPPYAV